MNPRGRYPPGYGNAGGGNTGGNPNYYARNPHPQQQYVPRNYAQSQQQQYVPRNYVSNRNQMGSDSGPSEVAKAVQPDGIDSRFNLLYIILKCVFISIVFLRLCISLRKRMHFFVLVWFYADTYRKIC